MSLITAMLNDLDERRITPRASSGVSLSTLTAQRHSPPSVPAYRYRLAVLGALLAIGVGLALTHWLQVYPWSPHAARNTEPGSSAVSASLGGTPATSRQQAPLGPADLKLSTAMNNLESETGVSATDSIAAEVTRVESLSIDESGGVATVQLGFSGGTHPRYAVFLLHNPARTVVEFIDVALSMAPERVIERSDLLAAMRTGINAHGQLQLIFDMHRQASLLGAELSDDGTRLWLRLDLDAMVDSAALTEQAGNTEEVSLSAVLKAETPPLSATEEAGVTTVPASRAIVKTPHEKSPGEQARAAYYRAATLLRAGNLPGAETLLQAALKADPAFTDARLLLASSLYKQQRIDAAYSLLGNGMEMFPEETKIKMFYARLLVERNALGPAIRVLESAPPEVAEAPDYHALLAAAHQRLGHHDAAIATYQAVLSRAPDNGSWWAGLGISLEATDRLTQARHAYQQALQVADLDPGLKEFVADRLAGLGPLPW